MMEKDPKFPNLFSPSFINAAKGVSFEGLSGDVSFDTNGDREG